MKFKTKVYIHVCDSLVREALLDISSRQRSIKNTLSRFNHTKAPFGKPSRYGLNVHVPTKVVCWSPNPQCAGIWQQSLWKVVSVKWGQEGKVSGEGGALAERVPGSSPPPCRGRHRRETAVHQPGGKLSPEPDRAGPGSSTSELQNCEKWVSAV